MAGGDIYSPLPTIPHAGTFISLTLVALAAGPSLGRQRACLIGELGKSNWACSMRPLPVLGPPCTGVWMLLCCEAVQLSLRPGDHVSFWSAM